MRHLACCSALSAAILLVLVGKVFGQNETGLENKQAEQTVVGNWQADTITLGSGRVEKRTFSKNELRTFYVYISENTVSMRIGDKQLAEMSYTLDVKQSPGTIDVKYQGQELPGMYELKGDKLKISLNDVKKGRPKKFTDKETDMAMILQRFRGEPLMIINADGSNLHTLMILPDYTSCGSPEWSHDGSKITFDTWRSVYGENYTQSHVFVVNADGSEPKDLGDGTLPSWSPDGKRIAYSRYSPNKGIWVINADGSDNRLIDSEGWSADWSPKKDELAYTINGNLCVRDLKTNARRYVLEKQYSQVYWGLSWSPDGQWICFKGDLPEGISEVAIVHAQGQAKGFKVLLPNEAINKVDSFDRYFSWSPDGKQILVPMIMEGDGNLQLYLLDPEGKAPPKKLAGQDRSVRNYGSSWSPDGKRIVLSFWPGVPVEKKEQTKSWLQRILGL